MASPSSDRSPQYRSDATSLAGEGGDARRGLGGDIGEHRGEHVHAVRRAHHDAALRAHTGAQQESVELDALVAQWVRLVDADERGRQPANVVLGGERRPRQGIPGVELLDAVGDRAAVVVQVEEDPFVLDR